MIFKCKNLTYLDKRPIYPVDRKYAEVNFYLLKSINQYINRHLHVVVYRKKEENEKKLELKQNMQNKKK